jgi:transitional endoplasmic reticulum ATPase
MFQQAQQQAPSIIFIDEIDSIAPKRSEATGEVERRVVAQLLTLMDGLEPRQNVVVIGATNRVNAIDEALRRPGRFDREIVIGVPDQQGRREVLAIHTRGMPLAEDVERGRDRPDHLRLRRRRHVGADARGGDRGAAAHLPQIDLDRRDPAGGARELRVSARTSRNALKRVQPSAMREIMIQVPDVDLGRHRRARGGEARRCARASSCR